MSPSQVGGDVVQLGKEAFLALLTPPFESPVIFRPGYLELQLSTGYGPGALKKQPNNLSL